MKKLLLVLLLVLRGIGQAQATGAGFVYYVGSAPSGNCSASSYIEQVIGLGTVYTCQSGTWAQISGGGGGSGTVTSVSGLAPLFTVATATTTPTFTRSTFAAHTFYGNNTGGTAAPAAEAVTEDDVTNLTADLALKAPLVSPTFTGTPAAPTAAQGTNTTQIATMAALQTAIQGVNPAVGVLAATTTVLPNSPTYSNGASGIGATLTAGSAAALVIDGYTPVLLDRILVKNQASSFQNGVYTLSTLGTGIIPYVLTRALDFDQSSDMNNTGAIPVINGTVNAVTQWVITSSVTTVGTDAVTFGQFSSNPATLGILVNAQSGNYTLNTSADRAAYLKFSGGTTATLTLCQITGTCANNYPFVVQNLNSGNLTVAANAADKIDNGSTGGSITVLPNFAAFVYQDSSSAPGNWWSIQVPTPAAFGTGIATFLQTPTSANLASALTNETGSGSAVFATSPTFVTPILGTPTSGTLTNATGLPEGGLSLTDITTANVSTSAHGFAPKAPNDVTKYLDGTAAYSVPGGNGVGYMFSSGTTSGGQAVTNATRVFLVSLPVGITGVTKLQVDITTAATGTDTYELGFYGPLNGINAVSKVCGTGATLASTLGINGTGEKIVTFSSCNMPAGYYYFAWTGSIAGTAAALGGTSTTPTNRCNQAPDTGNVTSGGALNSSITVSTFASTTCTFPQLLVSIQ